MDFEAGDVGYVQKTLPHYIENTGDTDLNFLEMFKSPATRIFRCPNGFPILRLSSLWPT